MDAILGSLGDTLFRNIFVKGARVMSAAEALDKIDLG